MNRSWRLQALPWARTVLGSALAGALLAACAVPVQQAPVQADVMDDLRDRVLRLERAVDQFQAPAQPPADLARRLADLGQQLEELAQSTRALAGRVDALEQAPPSPGPAAAAGGQALETRLTELAGRVAVLESGLRPAPAPTAPPTPAAPPAVAAPAEEPPAEPRASEQELYDRAYGLYKQGQYEEARAAFRTYLTRHPDTKLADNAQFWIGESFYHEAQYEQAILEYDKVVQEHPNGDKVSSALLKQAFAFDAIGDTVDAKILLKKLLREHPASEQAAIARKKLEILGD